MYYSNIVNPAHPSADKYGRVRLPLHSDQIIAAKKLAELRDQEDLSWPALKAAYERFCQAERAQGTLERVRAALASFEAFCAAKGRPLRRMSDVTKTLLLDWRGSRKIEGIGNPTVNRDVRAVKTMLYHACDMAEIPRPSLRFKRLPEVKGRLRWYRREEVAALHKVCRGPWEMVLRLGYQAGFRRSEIYWASREDVDLKRRVILVSAKEGWAPKSWEEREVDLGPGLLAFLKKWLRENDDYWLLGERPKNPDVMTAYFHKITKKSGLKDGGSVHVLRHTYGAWHAIAGTSLRHLQELLGHKDFASTEIYAHLQREALRLSVSRVRGL